MLREIEFHTKRQFKPAFFKFFCFIGRSIAPFIHKKLEKKKISKILIFQGGGIGDAIRIFPILKVLKDEFPDAEISILSPFDNRVFSLFPYDDIIKETIIFNVANQHKSILSKLILIKELRKKFFDLILCPQIGLGMVELAVLSFLIHAPYRVGYDMEGSGFLYTTKVALQKNKSIYEQHFELLSYSGICNDTCKFTLEQNYLSIHEKDNSFANSFLKRHNITEENLIITISPIVMADRDNKSPQHDRPLSESRSWFEQNYVELINKILQLSNVKVVLLGDKISNGALLDFLKSTNRPNVVSAIGQATISQSAALINKSHLFISNDSGMLHVAFALRKRCIGIFGSTSPHQVFPPTDNFVYIWKEVECSPCFVHQPIPDFVCPHDIKCLSSISVDAVLKEVKSLVVR